MATPFIIAKTKGNFTLSIKSKIKDKTPIINDNNNWLNIYLLNILSIFLFIFLTIILLSVGKSNKSLL